MLCKLLRVLKLDAGKTFKRWYLNIFPGVYAITI